jgi:Tol biopolymer transport system component
MPPRKASLAPTVHRACVSSGSRDVLTAAGTPDGARLAFTGDVRAERGTDREVFVVDAGGSNRRQLTTGPGSDRGGTWSPDGARILFTSAREGNDEINVMNADGSGQRRLTTTPEGGTTRSGRPTAP